MEEVAQILISMPVAPSRKTVCKETTPEHVSRKATRKSKVNYEKDFVLTSVKRRDDDSDTLLVTYRRGVDTFQVPVLPSSTDKDFRAAVKRKLEMIESVV